MDESKILKLLHLINEKVEAGGAEELIQTSILSKLLGILKEASLDNQVKILIVVKQFTFVEQGLIELHAINFVDELMKLPIATAANRVYSMPICEILFQLLDYKPATESLKKTVLPWLVQLISSADHGYDAPFMTHALKTLSKLLNKDPIYQKFFVVYEGHSQLKAILAHTKLTESIEYCLSLLYNLAKDPSELITGVIIDPELLRLLVDIVVHTADERCRLLALSTIYVFSLADRESVLNSNAYFRVLHMLCNGAHENLHVVAAKLLASLSSSTRALKNLEVVAWPYRVFSLLLRHENFKVRCEVLKIVEILSMNEMFHQLILDSNGVQVVTKVLKLSIESQDEEMKAMSNSILESLGHAVSENAIAFAENSRRRGFISIEEACLIEEQYPNQDFKMKGIELLSDKFLESEKNSGDRVESSEDEIQVLRKTIKEKLKAQQAEEAKRKERIRQIQLQEEQRAEMERIQNEDMRALDELQVSLEQQLAVQREKEREKERAEALEREKLRYLKKVEEDKLLNELHSKLEQEKLAKLQFEEKMRQEKEHQERLLREKLQAEKQRQEEQGKSLRDSKSSFTCLSDLDEFMTDLDIIVTTRSLADGVSDLQARIDQEKELRREREQREREMTARITELELAQRKEREELAQMSLSLSLSMDRPSIDVSPRRGLSPDRAGSPIAISPRYDDQASLPREEVERQEQRDRKEQERARKQARRDHQEMHGRASSLSPARRASMQSDQSQQPQSQPPLVASTNSLRLGQKEHARARSQSPQPRGTLSPREKTSQEPIVIEPTPTTRKNTDLLDMLKNTVQHRFNPHSSGSSSQLPDNLTFMSNSSELTESARANVTVEETSPSSKLTDKERKKEEKEEKSSRPRISSGGKGSMPSSCDVSPRSSTSRIHVPSKVPSDSAASLTSEKPEKSEKAKRSSKIMNLRIDLPKLTSNDSDSDRSTARDSATTTVIDEDGSPGESLSVTSSSSLVVGEARTSSVRSGIFVRKRSGTGAKHLRGPDSARGSGRGLNASRDVANLFDLASFDEKISKITVIMLENEDVVLKLNNAKPINFCLNNPPKLATRNPGKDFEVMLGSSKDFQAISVSLSKSGTVPVVDVEPSSPPHSQRSTSPPPRAATGGQALSRLSLESLQSKIPQSGSSAELAALDTQSHAASSRDNSSPSPRGSRKSEKERDAKEATKELSASIASPRPGLTSRASQLLMATDRPKPEKSGGYMSGRLASKSKLQHAQRKSKVDVLKEQREQKEKKIQGVKDQASCFSQQVQDGLAYLMEVTSL